MSAAIHALPNARQVRASVREGVLAMLPLVAAPGTGVLLSERLDRTLRRRTCRHRDRRHRDQPRAGGARRLMPRALLGASLVYVMLALSW